MPRSGIAVAATIAPADLPAAGTRVAVGLSGGVDSAVAALLLRDHGCDVLPVFMKNWEEDDDDGYCSAAADLADAERVCESLGLTLRTVNFSAEYWERVFEQLVAGYRAGQTPNPDTLCNRELKFGPFRHYAHDLGAEWLATGHYARVLPHADGGVRLLCGLDPGKDQSYFLYLLGQSELRRAVFPLGSLRKHAVRNLALRAGLPVHHKRDSTGICFVGERPFRTFMQRFMVLRPGPVQDMSGHEIGQHQGAACYTPGQREGLGIGGRRGGTGAPWYVATRDLARNIIVAVQGRDHPALWRRLVHTESANWIGGHAPPLPAALQARIRHRQVPAACHVSHAGDGGLRVHFEQPQWAPAAGQALVLYRGDECLGGAIMLADASAQAA